MDFEVAHNMAGKFQERKRNPKITLADGSDIFNCLKFSESSDDNESYLRIEIFKKDDVETTR